MRRLKAEPAEKQASVRVEKTGQNTQFAEPATPSESKAPFSDEGLSDLSRIFVDVMPRAMWSIRAGIRQVTGEVLTMPQFRVLNQLRKSASTNGELAELMGVSVPAMSRMVDGLVEMGFVVRVPQDHDRRQVRLELNLGGRRKLKRLQKHTHDLFMRRFSALDLVRRQELLGGLNVLEDLFP